MISEDLVGENSINPEFEEAESWVKFLQKFLLNPIDQRNTFICIVALLEKLRENPEDKFVKKSFCNALELIKDVVLMKKTTDYFWSSMDGIFADLRMEDFFICNESLKSPSKVNKKLNSLW